MRAQTMRLKLASCRASVALSDTLKLTEASRFLRVRPRDTSQSAASTQTALQPSRSQSSRTLYSRSALGGALVAQRLLNFLAASASEPSGLDADLGRLC